MKTTTILMSALLATSMITLLAPSADAHFCQAEDPEDSCGDCKEGTHNHIYNSGHNYCYSGEEEVCAAFGLVLDGRCNDIFPA